MLVPDESPRRLRSRIGALSNGKNHHRYEREESRRVITDRNVAGIGLDRENNSSFPRLYFIRVGSDKTDGRGGILLVCREKCTPRMRLTSIATSRLEGDTA